ncbi:MAG: hypothetical protein ACI8RD_006438 [Bacillariaceae sp.]|jgi:hypothetical protein
MNFNTVIRIHVIIGGFDLFIGSVVVIIRFE